jgi:glutamine synthetase
MFKTPAEVLAYIKKEDVKFLDIRFTDLPGIQQHFNIPASTVDEEFFSVGQLFDGSSITGFQGIAESDLQLIPDVTTAYLDPYRVEKTLILIFDIYNPRNGEIYHRDPRQVAKKAEKYLASTGIADTAFFAPEAEFFIFDDVRYEVSSGSSFYHVDSEEAAWNTGREEEGGNLANKTPYKGGYFPVSPVDKLADLRDQICLQLAASGLHVERSHHEVGTAGQCEINYRFDTMVRTKPTCTARLRPSCPSRSSTTTALGCTPTSLCGPTGSPCSTTKRVTRDFRTSLGGTSAESSSTRVRSSRSRTPR